MRLADVAEVKDSVQDVRNAGMTDAKPAIILAISRAPDANIIETVDRIRAELPALQENIPASIQLNVAQDRSPTIRASLAEVEQSLAIAIGLVILVVFIFLRSGRATLIPAVAVPVSLVGSFAAMYLCGFSLNNLSLMALTIATGFVVDDAIVVLENISRHVEAGMKPINAALLGARSRLHRAVDERFAGGGVYPAAADGRPAGAPVPRVRRHPVGVDRAVAHRLAHAHADDVRLPAAPPAAAFAAAGARLRQNAAGAAAGLRTLAELGARPLALGAGGVPRHPCAQRLAVYQHPETFFPEQDTGRLMGFIQADQSISFQAMRGKLEDFMKIVREDPDVENVTGFTGGSRTNSGSMFISLKPLSVRSDDAQKVIARLRARLAKEPGASLFLMAVQDIRVGGRQANASYQYTLLADDLAALREWEPKIRIALAAPELADVNSDQQDKGSEMDLVYDRETMARLGISVSDANNLLNNAFGQRQISTIYQPLNQYKVVMEVAPPYTQDVSSLDKMFIINNEGKAIPLSYFASWRPANAPLSVNHQGLSAASTISFNLPDGGSLSDATAAVERTMTQLGVPSTVRGAFAGTAQVFQDTLKSQLILILAAIATVYIVLGVLYELYPSADHPFHAAFRRRRGAVGARAVRRAVQPDRADRHYAVDRHREEKRHHDGRLRPRGAAQRRHQRPRGNFPGQPAAFPADHDDHAGGCSARCR